MSIGETTTESRTVATFNDLDIVEQTVTRVRGSDTYTTVFFSAGDWSFEPGDDTLEYAEAAVQSWTAWRDYLRSLPKEESGAESGT